MHIGILGGGQLARMLSLAAYPLGITCSALDPTPHPCASEIIECICADYSDYHALDRLIAKANVITYENENIPLTVAQYIHQRKPLHPAPLILQHSQDRVLEKQFLNTLGIATTPFMAIASLNDLLTALNHLQLPIILKTRRLGYDGKGQYRINTLEDAQQAWQQLASSDLIAEAFVPFKQELSLIAVRNANQTLFYPLTVNHHQAGILRLSEAPFNNINLQNHAEHIAAKILQHTNYIGVLAIEFFQQQDTLLVNELAPRVHNSGHWTIEGAITSQFENHVRAICNLPLGETTTIGKSAMFNCLGHMPDKAAILAIPATHLHDYHKPPQPLRKVGHITLNAIAESAFNPAFSELHNLLISLQ